MSKVPLFAPVGPIPARQAQCLEFVRLKLSNGGEFPPLAEIAKHMGWRNEHSARDCLDRLVWRGLLIMTKDDKLRRHYRLVERLEAAE